jgi:hypothetical protein
VLQLYSDKAQVNNKLRSVHPVKFALLNAPYSKRIKRLSTVCYIPVLNKPPNMPTSLWRLVKLALHSEVLGLLLAPLKALSHSGKLMLDPSGVQRMVYPRFGSYVMDSPEGADVTMVKGVPSKHPCESCLCPKEELLNIDHDTHPERTVEQQKQNYKELKSSKLNATARADLSARLSTQPVKCALFGFADQDCDGWGSIMHVMGYEAMHNEDLGVFPYIISILEKYLLEVQNGRPSRSGLVTWALREMNERHGWVPPTGKLVYIKLHTLRFSELTSHSCRGLQSAFLWQQILPRPQPRAG